MTEVSLQPGALGAIGALTVSNTMFSTFACSAILIAFGLFMRGKWQIVPGRTQMVFEILVDFIMEKMTMAYGSEERARKYFPLFFTFFIFLLLANNFTWIPFIESVVTQDGVKLFTTPGAHYSLPIAMALITVLGAHIIALSISPIKHIANFIKIGPMLKAIKERSLQGFFMSIIDFFLGILDIIGEIAKIISLSTRLFGNIFAGGVIIAIISGLSFYTQFFVPIPFLVLGLLSGVVQAFVFSMLGILFMSATVNNVVTENS